MKACSRQSKLFHELLPVLIRFSVERGKYQGNFFLAIYMRIPVKFVQFIFWIFLTCHMFAALVFNQLFAYPLPLTPPKVKVTSLGSHL